MLEIVNQLCDEFNYNEKFTSSVKETSGDTTII